MSRRIAEIVIQQRLWILLVILGITGFFGYRSLSVQMYTEFADLLPQAHPYIQVHNQIRETFGGANVITIMLEVEEGDIANAETLAKIDHITREADKLPGVNHNQLISIATHKARDPVVSFGGMMKSELIFDPTDPPETPEQFDELRETLRSNPNVYGVLVSRDLKAAAIRADFFEDRIDYQKLFEKVQKIRDEVQDGNHHVWVTGRPMLVGWIYHYFPEMIRIFLATAAVIVFLLFFYFRRAQGVLVPLVAANVSAIWGFGFIGILGYNLDPLVLVIPMLITARAISHAVQFVERFLEEFDETGDVKESSRLTTEELFLPGILGIVTDAAGIFLISVATIPLMQKLAYFCSFWAMSIIVSVLILVPIMLSYMPAPRRGYEAEGGVLRRVLPVLAGLATGRRSRWAVVGVTAFFVLVAGLASTRLVIGDANPGSPILWQDSEYNLSTAKVNKHFPGSNELYLIVREVEEEEEEGDSEAEESLQGGFAQKIRQADTHARAMQEPRILRAMERFQMYMEADPKVGGSQSLSDVVKYLNQNFHNKEPKFSIIPPYRDYAGELLFAYLTSAPTPDVLAEYVDTQMSEANVTIWFKDHQGPTIARGIERAKRWIEENPIEGYEWHLAGGLIGVLAAVDEEIAYSHEVNLVLVLLVVFTFVSLSYRSATAGLLIMIPLLSATLFTFAYMAIRGIGMNINTLPVASVGIGVGVDYAIYVADRIKQEYRRRGSYAAAIQRAVTTTGMAVSFTATTLVGGVIFWYFFSSLRFQAEMSLLLSILMVVNMLGAMVLLPAMISILEPKFIRAEAEAEATETAGAPQESGAV